MQLRGWKNTMDSTSNVTGAPTYIIATGGTITCCGDYKIHTFTSDGCFSVSNAGTPVRIKYSRLFSSSRRWWRWWKEGGGGGAGGYRESSYQHHYPAPLAGQLYQFQ
jgi:hypothetical protein